MLPMRPVTIGGIDLTGMTKTQAKEALSAVANTLTAQPMVIRVLDEEITLSPQQTGIAPDVEGAVENAFREKATGSFDWLGYLHLDTDAITAAVESLGEKYNTDLSQTTIVATGEVPSLAPDADASEPGLTLTITIGSPEYGMDTDALYRQVLDAYRQGVLEVTGNCSDLQPEIPDLDALYESYYIAPVDAVMDPQTFEVSSDSYGYHFDLEKAKDALSQASYGDSFDITFQKIAPTVTATELSSTLFCDVLGSAQTPYNGKDTNNRNTNLALACASINGVVLLPGESFSYNNTLGERTAEAGYKAAPTYVDGLTVDTLGGGICQVSSTLHYSVLFADLQIDERHPHGYVSDYIPKGMDASVAWGGGDFRFTNSTNYPIRIEAWRADGYVNVNIWGTDERDYYIKMTYSVEQTIPYDTIYQEYPSDNPKGYKDGQVIVTAYTGYVVHTYKEKYSIETDERISREYYQQNNYKKRDKVICKIVDTLTE
jgi:vancomycin resistance protein YoaR